MKKGRDEREITYDELTKLPDKLCVKWNGISFESGKVEFVLEKLRYSEGYIVHYDSFHDKKDVMFRRIGRQNYIVISNELYKEIEDRIPRDIGIYIEDTRVLGNKAGKKMNVTELKLIRKSLSVEGVLSGRKRIELSEYRTMLGRKHIYFEVHGNDKCMSDWRTDPFEKERKEWEKQSIYYKGGEIQRKSIRGKKTGKEYIFVSNIYSKHYETIIRNQAKREIDLYGAHGYLFAKNKKNEQKIKTLMEGDIFYRKHGKTIEQAEEEKKKLEEKERKRASEEACNNKFRELTEKAKFIDLYRVRLKDKDPIEYSGICCELMDHQKAGVCIAEKYSRFGFYFDTGTGKTLLALEIIARKYAEKNARFIIVCPKTIINTAWLDDCDAFYPDMKIMPLTKNMSAGYLKKIYHRWKKKGAQIKECTRMYFEGDGNYPCDILKRYLMVSADHFIVNPEAFRTDYEKYINIAFDTVMEKGLIRIDGIIIDESSILRNSDTSTFKSVQDASSKMKYVYLLSGKPAPNRISEYAAQMKLLSPHLYDHWRHNYCYGNAVYLSQEERDNSLLDHIKNVSLTVSKEDCIQLPGTINQVRTITLPSRAREEYIYVKNNTWQVIQTNREENGQERELIFVLGNIMKLRQVASGFIKKEEANKTDFIHIHDEKMNELVNILSELGNSQVIVWCQFIYDIENIEDQLTMLGYSVVTAYGGTKNTDESICRFKCGEAQVLIAHPMTLKYGVTLVNCTYAVYYSLSYSFEEYYQSHDRIYRKGQNNTCTYIFLIAENTIDEIMYDAVMKKLSSSQFAENVLKHINDVRKSEEIM